MKFPASFRRRIEAVKVHIRTGSVVGQPKLGIILHKYICQRTFWSFYDIVLLQLACFAFVVMLQYKMGIIKCSPYTSLFVREPSGAFTIQFSSQLVSFALMLYGNIELYVQIVNANRIRQRYLLVILCAKDNDLILFLQLFITTRALVNRLLSIKQIIAVCEDIDYLPIKSINMTGRNRLYRWLVPVYIKLDLLVPRPPH